MCQDKLLRTWLNFLINEVCDTEKNLSKCIKKA